MTKLYRCCILCYCILFASRLQSFTPSFFCCQTIMSRNHPYSHHYNYEADFLPQTLFIHNQRLQYHLCCCIFRHLIYIGAEFSSATFSNTDSSSLLYPLAPNLFFTIFSTFATFYALNHPLPPPYNFYH